MILQFIFFDSNSPKAKGVALDIAVAGSYPLAGPL